MNKLLPPGVLSSSTVLPPCFHRYTLGKNPKNECSAGDLETNVDKLTLIVLELKRTGIRKICAHPSSFLQNND